MRDSSSQFRTSSFASFVLLPQFGRMFRSTAHIVPIFMRTIAGLLAQSGLLPPTHPATMYGDPGVEKCGFTEMLGDAWYTLRADSATPYQWSVFCSVILVIFFVISSIIMTIINISSVFVGSAAAQIFALKNAGTGGGTLKTGFASLAQDKSKHLWDNAFPALGQQGGHLQDYAIAFLDKILRLGANQMGTPLQNAVGALMSVYNTGIMVVAGIMLFWLIVSVVVDTAKTGQIGGGRHNMVWAPIRIIFALGLMVPLGANGFSSGQFMVMKIAELGSNFGSNAWHAYLSKVVQDSIYALPPQKNLMDLTGKLLRSWVCVVASNGYSDQAEGANLPNAQIIYRYPNIGVIDKGTQSYSLRKMTGSNECGTITLPTINDPSLGLKKGQKKAPTTFTNALTGKTFQDPIRTAEINFKIDMINAWRKLFLVNWQSGQFLSNFKPPTMSSVKNGTYYVTPQKADQTDGGQLTKIEQTANSFACGFVSQHIWGKDQGSGTSGSGSGSNNGKDVLHLNCQLGGSAQGGGGKVETNLGTSISCGAGAPASGQYPDMSCVEGATKSVEYQMQAAIMAAAQQSYNSHFKSLATKAFLTQDHGWADMGSFFRKLAQINSFVTSQSNIPVSITPGSIPNEGGLSQKINEVVNKFNSWWKTVPGSTPNVATASNNNAFGRKVSANGTVTQIGVSQAGAGSGQNSGSYTRNQTVHSCGLWCSIKGIGSFLAGTAQAIIQIGTSPTAFFMHQISNVVHGNVNQFLQADLQDSTVYPLSILVNLGDKLIHLGIDIHEALMAAVMLLAMIPATDIGDALANTTIVGLLGGIATIFLTSGATLAFWLPALPLIRVAFAVLSWAVAVFEAVALVPIAALSFLSTTGEGWDAKHVFLNWLDVFTRPVLTVIGFVGALLVFNTFFAYFYTIYMSFMQGQIKTQILSQSGINGFIFSMIGLVSYTTILFLVVYSAANTCFKMISTIPDAFFRWAPIGGSRSGFSEDGGDHRGAAARGAGMFGESMQRGGRSEAALARAGGRGVKKVIGKFKGQKPSAEDGNA